MSALSLGSCGPFGLTGFLFVSCSCFWARSLSANLWAFTDVEAAAAAQNGFETRLKRLPKPWLFPRIQRPDGLHLGAAILPGREGRAKTTWRRAARVRREWVDPAGHVVRGGAWGSHGGRCALSAAAPAGSCSWSSGVWRRLGECVGKQGWGWEMLVPQRFNVFRVPGISIQEEHWSEKRFSFWYTISVRNSSPPPRPLRGDVP